MNENCAICGGRIEDGYGECEVCGKVFCAEHNDCVNGECPVCRNGRVYYKPFYTLFCQLVNKIITRRRFVFEWEKEQRKQAINARGRLQIATGHNQYTKAAV